MAVEQDGLARIELIIGNLLRYGVILCSIVIAVGLVMSFMTPLADHPALSALLPNVLHGGLLETANPLHCQADFTSCLHNPETVIALGLAMLVGLPVARVALTMGVFALQKDWIYTGLSAVVLGVLLIGILYGKEF